MKTKQHFIATEIERKYSKTYGGSTYTLNLYEIIKKGELKHLGTVTACTRGHRGEISEAWVKLQQLKVVKPGILKTIVKNELGNYRSEGIYQYYYHSYENIGVKLEILN